MPDPSKEKALKAYNNIEIWVEADGQRLNESTITFDEEEGRHRSCLYTPLNMSLTINLAVRSKGPIPSDLAIEISLDGRPIHPTFIKRGNHRVNQISHIFSSRGIERIKRSLIVQKMAMSTEAGSLSEDVGEIHIAVYRATVVKKKTPSAVTNFPSLTAHETEMKSNPLHIIGGVARPCTNQERKSDYWCPAGYKGAGVEPLITYVYEYHERLDDTGGEESKGGIKEAMKKRTHAVADAGVIEKIGREVEGVKERMDIMQGDMQSLTRQVKRQRQASSAGTDSGIIADDDEVPLQDEEEEVVVLSSRPASGPGRASPLSSIGGGGSDDGPKSPQWNPRPRVWRAKAEPM